MIKYMRAYHLYTLISVNDKVKIKHVKDWKCDKFGDNGLIIEIDYDDYNVDKYFINFTHEECKKIIKKINKYLKNTYYPTEKYKERRKKNG